MTMKNNGEFRVKEISLNGDGSYRGFLMNTNNVDTNKYHFTYVKHGDNVLPNITIWGVSINGEPCKSIHPVAYNLMRPVVIEEVNRIESDTEKLSKEFNTERFKVEEFKRGDDGVTYIGSVSDNNNPNMTIEFKASFIMYPLFDLVGVDSNQKGKKIKINEKIVPAIHKVIMDKHYDFMKGRVEEMFEEKDLDDNYTLLTLHHVGDFIYHGKLVENDTTKYSFIVSLYNKSKMTEFHVDAISIKTLGGDGKYKITDNDHIVKYVIDQVQKHMDEKYEIPTKVIIPKRKSDVPDFPLKGKFVNPKESKEVKHGGKKLGDPHSSLFDISKILGIESIFGDKIMTVDHLSHMDQMMMSFLNKLNKLKLEDSILKDIELPVFKTAIKINKDIFITDFTFEGVNVTFIGMGNYNMGKQKFNKQYAIDTRHYKVIDLSDIIMIPKQVFKDLMSNHTEMTLENNQSIDLLKDVATLTKVNSENEDYYVIHSADLIEAFMVFDIKDGVVNKLTSDCFSYHKIYNKLLNGDKCDTDICNDFLGDGLLKLQPNNMSTRRIMFGGGPILSKDDINKLMSYHFDIDNEGNHLIKSLSELNRGRNSISIPSHRFMSSGAHEEPVIKHLKASTRGRTPQILSTKNREDYNRTMINIYMVKEDFFKNIELIRNLGEDLNWDTITLDEVLSIQNHPLVYRVLRDKILKFYDRLND